MVKIICGPVIGLVTSSSARILLEVDESTGVKITLNNSGTGKIHEKILDSTSKIPGIAQFDDLEPGSSYSIQVPDISKNHVGEVRTLPTDVTSLGIAMVSCDRPTKDFSSKMWDRLYEKGKADGVHVVLHLGDNVYVDNETFKDNQTDAIVNGNDIIFDPEKVDQSAPYVKGRKILRDLSRDGWPDKRDEILDIYRSKYREVWSRKDKARVLANFSNVMILDDHDLRDDIGLMEADSDPESVEFFLGNIALQVYHEYQRHLCDTDALTMRDSFKHEGYRIDFGPVCIMLTDTRTPASLYVPRRQKGDESYLGKEQLAEISKCYKSPCDDKPRLIIMAYPRPLIFLKRKISQILHKMNISDELVTSINAKHQDELTGILNDIWKWKQMAGTASDCLLVSGDVHIGGFTDIFKNVDGEKQLLCRQIVTSPIQNKHYGLFAYAATRSALHFTENYEDFSYMHYDWVNKCNFAVISVSVADKISYTVSIVNEKSTEVRESYDENWDKGLQSTPSNCCAVM